MLFSRSEGCKVEPPRDTFMKGFGNLYNMLILILFYVVGQVFISNVSTPPPSPFSAAVHFNPIITSTAPPLPHTRSRKSGPCECGQTRYHLAVIPVRFPL